HNSSKDVNKDTRRWKEQAISDAKKIHDLKPSHFAEMTEDDVRVKSIARVAIVKSVSC
ncbi:Uncharacterized protein APZ42_009760, partial [Daphnia magna]